MESGKTTIKIRGKPHAIQHEILENKYFVLIILCLGVISPSVYAQSFDQNFQEWKAKQQMYDQKLNITKSSHSNGSKFLKLKILMTLQGKFI